MSWNKLSDKKPEYGELVEAKVVIKFPVYLAVDGKFYAQFSPQLVSELMINPTHWRKYNKRLVATDKP